MSNPYEVWHPRLPQPPRPQPKPNEPSPDKEKPPMKKSALLLFACVLALCGLARPASASHFRSRAVVVSRPFVSSYGYGRAFVAPVVLQSYYAAPLVAPAIADPYAAPVVAAPAVPSYAAPVVVGGYPSYSPFVIRQRAFVAGHGRSAVIIRRR